MLRRTRRLDKQSFYGERYFDAGGDRAAGISGYGSYERSGTNADVAAYLLWRGFDVSRTLDVGCAKGFVVEALCELGADAHGWDVSAFAVSQASPAVRARLSVVDLERRRWGRHPAVPLVSALEVLEHLRPEAVPAVLRRLRSVCSGYLVATIPSIGINDFGPHGFPDGKVAWDRLAHYHSLTNAYDGPVPYDDLLRDDHGHPVEGHLTIASFRWWTRQFEAAGFTRRGEIERQLHPVVGRFGLSVAWNLYVFSVPGAPDRPVRSEAELAEVERRWSLTDRQPDADSIELTGMTVGPEAVAAIDAELAASRARGAQ